MEWDAFPFTDWNPAFGDQNFELEDPSAFNYDSPSPPEDPCPAPVPAPIPPQILPVPLPAVERNPSPKLHNVIALPPLNVRSALNPDMPRLFLQKNMVKGKKGYKAHYSIDYSKKEEVVAVTSSNESSAKQAVCQRTVSIPWENQMLRYVKLKNSNIDQKIFSKRKENGDMGRHPAPGQQQPFYQENYNPGGYWQYPCQEQYYCNQENTGYYDNQQVAQGNYYDNQQVRQAGYHPVPENYPSSGYYNENYCNFSQEKNYWEQEITPNEGLGPITADLPILTDISEYLSTSPGEFQHQYDQGGDNAPIESNDYEQCAQILEEPIARGFYNYTGFCDGPAAEIRPEIPSNLDSGSNSMPYETYLIHHMESPVTTGSTVISTPQITSSVPEIVENIYRTAGMRNAAENYEKGPKQEKVAARAPSLYEKRYIPHFKTKDQKAYLEQCFQENHRPTAMELEMISSKLNLSLKQVRTWYYNRRAKANEGPSLKPGCSNFSGPTRH